MNQELNQIDEFIVIRKQLLSLQHLEVLNKLYLPLLSAETIGIYHYLYQLPQTFSQRTVKVNHGLMMNDLNSNLEYILTHRHKLEALGLLKVYVKIQTSQLFIYEIIPPLSAQQFFNNALLYTLLSEYIGETRVLQLKQQLLSYNDYSDYQDVTRKFDDIYQIKNQKLYQIKKNETAVNKDEQVITTHQQFDWLALIQLLGDNFITETQLTDEVRKTAQDIFILYNTTVIDMKNILLSSLDQYQKVDINKFKNNARQYYKFYNANINYTLPKSIDINTKQSTQKISKLDKLAQYYDSHSPVMVLIRRFNAPISEDVQQSLEKIVEKYQFSHGVMNVLCDYCLQQTKKNVLPNYKYLDKVAADFSTHHLTSAKEAMEYVIKNKQIREHNKINRQQLNSNKTTRSTYNQVYKKQEPIPQYMQKQTTMTTTQDEKYIEEVKNLINNRGES